MNIAVCDDEAEQRLALCAAVSRWDGSANVKPFSSAEAFEFAREGGAVFDAALLDIKLGGEDGLALARRIRKTDGRMQLVFITSFTEFIAEGYEVDALHYLVKPVSEQKLREVLDRAAKRLNEAAASIVVSTQSGRVCLRASEISYAEILSHELRIYADSGVYETSMSIAAFAEKLPKEGFARCHRSYVVALDRIVRISRGGVLLRGGAEVPVSKGEYAAVNEAFIGYYKKKHGAESK